MELRERTRTPLTQTTPFIILFGLLSLSFLWTLIDMVNRWESAPLTCTHFVIGIITIGGTLVGPVLIRANFRDIQDFGPWLQASSIVAWYAAMVLILRLFWLGKLTPTYVGFALLQSVALLLVFGTFSHPISPHNKFSDIRRANKPEFIKSHLDNWWRVGQIVLTSTVVVAGGLFVWAFPRGGSAVARNRVAYLGLPFAISFGAIMLFILLKTRYLEEKMTTYM